MDKISHSSLKDVQPSETIKDRPNIQRSQATRLTFVNINDWQQAASSDTISQIRSHVAKEKHARVRQERINNLQVRTLPPRPKDRSDCSSTAPYEKPQTAQESPQESGLGLLDRSSAADSSKKAALKEISLFSAFESVHTIPSPQVPIGCGRTFAREINETEKYLLNSFVELTDSHGNSMQKQIKNHKELTKKLKGCWVPYSINKAVLIDTIFLKAANSLAARTHEDSRQRWDLIACAYKQKCLRHAIEAIKREADCPRDDTIALVISIAADDYIMGHWEGWVLHGKGAIELVKKRGGLQALQTALDGLLLQMVAWSVFNPRFKIVQGPDPEELLEIPEFQPAR